MTSFADLGLSAPILKALAAENYHTPTPIQGQAIPHLLAGRDLLGIAQTGTGKTAAFALPILHRLAADRRPAERRGCRALVLSPTRELATQIADSFRAYGRGLGLSTTVVFGGVGFGGQSKVLAGGVDVLVATPGRLLDHLGQRTLRLDKVEVFVLDEADQMLDMGFIRDIRRVVTVLPKARQNLFFSATMPKEIGALAGELLTDPVKVAVTPVASTVEKVDQTVIFVDADRKRALLAGLLADETMQRVLVFTRTKHGADKVARHLTDAGVEAAAIHGNKSQSQRERALASFKTGRTRALVATDIAARGIDVDGVTHVVNFELPNVAESYVHRIGRTARAGAAGVAISLCAPDERAHLRGIESLIRQRVPVLEHALAGRRRGGEAPPRPEAPARQAPAPRHRQEAKRPSHSRSRAEPAEHVRAREPHARGESGLGQVGFMRPAYRPDAQRRDGSGNGRRPAAR